jgi:uncharacterized protein
MSSADSFNESSFYEKLRMGELQVARCRDCGNYLMPPSPVCKNCMSRNLEWVELSGNGRVISFSEIHVTSAKFKDLVPYIVAVIETTEGVRMAGMVKGASRSDLLIGSKVIVEIDPRASESWPFRPSYYFKLVRN